MLHGPLPVAVALSAAAASIVHVLHLWETSNAAGVSPSSNRPSLPDLSPTFPPFNLTWTPTYSMSRSTITNPTGNLTGPDSGQLLNLDASYGIIVFDGGYEGCLTLRKPPAPDADPCMYAETFERTEIQAKTIQRLNPNTHVWGYINMQLGLSRNTFDCPKMYDPSYRGFWLQDKITGEPISELTDHPLRHCPGGPSDPRYVPLESYYLDWRNASARQWWLDTKLSSMLRSSVLDGFYWDDPIFGNEHPQIRDNYPPRELAEIDYHMQQTRLEGYQRLSNGGGFCVGSTCPVTLENPARCVCNMHDAPHAHDCTCDTSPETLRANLLEANATYDEATVMTTVYPDIRKEVDVECDGPAAVVVVPSSPEDGNGPSHVPASILQLSCLPGTGVMTVDFASFGRPRIGGGPDPDNAKNYKNGVFEPRTAQCSAFAVDDTCDAGPQVLHRIKEKCDGKQSCRFSVDDPIFTPPASGCDNDGKDRSTSNANNEEAEASKQRLWLAAGASGCQFGTGGNERANFREDLAAFLLTRGPHSWMGHGWIGYEEPVWFPEWDVDFGAPLEGMRLVTKSVEEGGGTVAVRRWSKMTVSLDLDAYEANFTSVDEEEEAGHQWKSVVSTE